jgi:predicted dehydrogenase
VKERKSIGDLRKVVVRDGHQGPKEIGTPPEFFRWLSDPVRNGAGALFDFGCYGANIMTWLMDNKKPLTVSAVTQTIKPDIYPKVDDDATVILTYPQASAILQPSWNWPYSRKDMDLYGKTGSIQTIKTEIVKIRREGQTTEDQITASPFPAPYGDPLDYFAAVVRGTIKPSGLSSLENNMIVTEILDAARRSAKTGQTVRLLP